jgi:two-component system, OmpR family, sensor histidine kinase SenX3
MGRFFGFRMLVAACGALAVLLAALAAVQYSWSTRVAAADAQREKEHLNSAADLFANQFNQVASQASDFLQNSAWPAVESGQPVAGVPKLIGDLYFVDLSAASAKAMRLMGDGRFAAAGLPPWAAIAKCVPAAIEQPPAMVAPVSDVARPPERAPQIREPRDRGRGGLHVFQSYNLQPKRCFVAQIDLGYLRDTLLPQLIRQSFGATASQDYDFAVVPRGRPGAALYGRAMRFDLRRPFFSIAPFLGLNRGLPHGGRHGPPSIFVERRETFASPGVADLFGPGIWDLEVARHGLPLNRAFEQVRRRDLLFSLAVEGLLAAAIVFLVIGSQRMARLADQKMQFIAGVSHELRSPVSAISMLSRNQADGLVAGADKVKQYGELIHQQSRRLSEMVEQTLQYAGIHSGLRRPARDEIDLAALIREAVEARREELARSGFEVEVAVGPGLPLVVGDAKLLRTAFDNLLSNAQKYAGGARWIRVSAGYDMAEKEVRIAVEDHGVGIEPGDQAEIFEPFCRGRAAIEAQIPGSGLGLSLVRSAAEAHHGSVTLVSEPGRGSTFTLHLPV